MNLSDIKDPSVYHVAARLYELGVMDRDVFNHAAGAAAASTDLDLVDVSAKDREALYVDDRRKAADYLLRRATIARETAERFLRNANDATQQADALDKAASEIRTEEIPF